MINDKLNKQSIKGSDKESIELMGELAVVAHGLAGNLESLGIPNVAILQAFTLVGCEVGIVEGGGASEALVKTVLKHLCLELLGMNFSLCLHNSLFLLIIIFTL